MRDTSAYRVAGSRVFSVTEILSVAGMNSFAGIAPDVLERARVRGVRVHEYTEFIDTGLELNQQPDAELLPYVKAYCQFKEDTGFQITYTEHVVVSKRYRYAGTLDRAGHLRFSKKPDELCLVDIKCVATVSPATALQTAAYALALEEQEGVAVTRRASLQLKSDGKYRLKIYDDDNDTADWLACCRIANFKLRAGLAQLEE